MARDVNRIGKTLEIIRKAWLSNPDLRLGQLLVNDVGEAGLYYVEDDVLCKVLEEKHSKGDEPK